MSTEEFEAQCKDLCPRCANGDPVRLRTDSGEWVHDWSFGGTDPKTGLMVGRGHGVCQADAFRKTHG
jgi:hypothetical protein